ncbi:MAG: ABC transporter ATP-binding protein [Planctomycetota bacterium]
MTLAIEVRGLEVRYGSHVAVSGLDLEVRAGEVFGFLGPNGAGKTTTIRALLDLLRPDRGRVEVLGEPVRGAGGRLRERLGFLPGDLALFPSLRGSETLDFFARLYRRPPRRRDEVLDALGFPREALRRRIRTYSTGMRQMIGITVAMQHDPDLLVLDEPTTGLDPRARGLLELLRVRADEGRTVLFSSHVLAEVERSADRLGLVKGGRVHLTEEVASLRERLPKRVRVRRRDGSEEQFLHEGELAPLLARLAAEGEALADLEVRPVDLAEIFRREIRDEEFRA